MVKVITIMDDVYAELSRLKRSRGMSFSEAIRFLLQQNQSQGKNLIGLAGTLQEFDIDRRSLHRIRGEHNGKNLFG